MIKIRPAGKSDADAIARVHDQSRRHAYAKLLPEEALNQMSLEQRMHFWREQILMAADRDLKIMVAEVAAVTSGKEGDYDVAAFLAVAAQRGKNIAEIDRLYVSPQHLRKGIGKQLVNTALNELRDYGYERVFVWTFEDNWDARKFYYAMGMKPDGAERKYPRTPKEVRYCAKIDPW